MIIYINKHILFCYCGCGEKAKRNKKNPKIWNKYIYGHNCNRKGEKATQETRDKLSKAKIGKNHPMFGKHHTQKSKDQMSASRIGREVTQETRDKIGKANKGKIISIEQRKKISKSLIGNKHTPESKEKMRIANSGENGPNWKGGISNNPYCQVWTDKEYRQDIRDRDDNKCQNPDCWNTSKRLCGHHINYDKTDCRPINVITVCTSCNSRANTKREWWQKFYQSVMSEKYNRKEVS